MNTLVAMTAGLAGGALAAVTVSFLATWITRALRVSERNREAGYLELLVGVLPVFVGMIVAIVLTLRWRH
jgi:hypothetical protein